MKKSILITMVLTSSLMSAVAQINGGPVNVPVDGVVDGVYVKEHIPTKRLIPYEYVREADYIWSNRVWSYIDLREKINLNLYYPLDEITMTGDWIRNNSRWSLWTIIRNHVITGDLRVFSAYNPNNVFGERDGDQLKYPVDPELGLNFKTDSVFRERMVFYLGKLGAQSDVPLTDEFGDPIEITLPDGSVTFKYPPQDTIWYTSKDIVQYRLKTDWFFDKERSVLDQRIIAIAPVVYETEESNGVTSIKGYKELFWLYYPQCRYVFNNYYVYNDKNDAQWMSFDDLFWKRRFTEVAYKESNTYDRTIETYATGIDALLESERVKDEIRTLEHDMWHF